MTNGTQLNLTHSIIPSDSTYQTVLWSLKDAGGTGAVLSNNSITTTKAGIVTVTATVLSSQIDIISGGHDHSAAIMTDGSLWTWGSNEYGQLGDGTEVDKSYPVQIPGSWASISAGNTYTAAIMTDGSLWTWGSNTSGQLGSGGYTSELTPVKIPGLWKSVSVEGNYLWLSKLMVHFGVGVATQVDNSEMAHFHKETFLLK